MLASNWRTWSAGIARGIDGHRPVGYGGHRGGQIQLCFAAIARILQEGAQRTGQEFGSLSMQMRRLLLYKARDVTGAKV